MKIKKLIFGILFITTFLILKQTTNAQTALPKGITVIPSIMYVDLARDPADYDLKYINNTNSDITLLLSSQDFDELEDGYKLNFLEGKDAQNYKYSLSSWISFENKNLHLQPKEEKTVKIFIDKNRITRGGHYASIQAKVEQETNNKAININPVISSLLFVRASTGQEIESGKISSFRPERRFWAFPESFALRFQNSGNVYVIPYGKVEVTGPFNKPAARGILNEGSLNALPESIRKYNVMTNKSSKVLLPGIYKARIDMKFGDTNQTLTQEIKFFSWGHFNFIKIGGFLIILGLIFYFIRKLKFQKK